MDPLSVTAAILAVVQLTNNTAQIALRVARAAQSIQGDRYKELYWRLFAEKGAMTALVTKIETSGQPLSPENVKTFAGLLPELHDLHLKMENALLRLLPKSPTTMRTLAHRVRFESGGFEELKQTMTTIETMTRALKIVGETLPSYTPRSDHRSSSAPGIPPTSMLTESPQSFRGSQSDVNVEEEVESSSSLRQTEPSTTLASLCRLCEEAMLELSTDSSLQRKDISKLLARLELWSFGVLHTKDRPLDMLLKADAGKHEAIRVFVTKSLVNLGVALSISSILHLSDPN
jgi:hypothetical protein